jgi:uncharacterized protein (DUF58 family)
MRITIIPTPKALVLAVVAAAAAWAGAVLGVFALFAFAVGISMLVVIGLASVLHGGLRSWKIDRVLQPAPARVGIPVTVEITAVPVRSFAPSVALFEPTPWGTRRLGLTSRIAKREPLRVTWKLPTLHRGVLTAGPGLLFRHDLLSLFRRRVAELPSTHVVVHPRTVWFDSSGLRRLVGTEALGPSDQLESGDMRTYVPGDDPRRVNWKASARTMSSGSLIVVDQKSSGRESNATVILDLEGLAATNWDDDDVQDGAREIAISVAASIVEEFAQRPGSGTRCELRVIRGAHLIHRSFDAQENVTALAVIEQHEFEHQSNLANNSAHSAHSTHSASSEGAAESAPSIRSAIVITGPSGAASGRVTFRCGPQSQATTSSRLQTPGIATCNVESIESFARLVAEL